MENKFFRTYEINERTTCIEGLAGELCYLVQGKERALLIDGLTGAGSLKAFVRELTDLPVNLVLTHAHLDHCGADSLFRRCLQSQHPDFPAWQYQC